ncbi:hypothetical protein ACP70R_010868 [Stipagrostis hirtigluma subsp. patula]
MAFCCLQKRSKPECEHTGRLTNQQDVALLASTSSLPRSFSNVNAQFLPSWICTQALPATTRSTTTLADSSTQTSAQLDLPTILARPLLAQPPMAPPPVRIVDVSYVAVPAAGAPPPEPIKLNAMEAQWVVMPVLQHLLFFEGDQLPPFDAVVQSLKSSLAATLATHAPLAGKLHYLPETGDVAIVCSGSDDGVRFVVAESDADVRRLAGDEEHDVHAFERLVPEVDMGELPAPLLAVQATRLEGPGVAVGITVHHAVADGRSLWRFVESWAAACRGDTPPAPPSFDRSRVSLPGGDELARSVLRKYAPNLPVASWPSSVVMEERMRFSRRTFTLDAQHVERLKQRVVRLGPFPDDDDAFLFFFADARGRLDPPAGEDYFGACLSGCLARLPARELRAERALAAAAAAVQGAVREAAEHPLAGWEFLSLPGESLNMDRLMNVSGSSTFRAYEVADFGWGRPRRTEPIRMNHDGQVALVRARDGDGVQASVSMLQRAHMEFEFLELLG